MIFPGNKYLIGVVLMFSAQSNFINIEYHINMNTTNQIYFHVINVLSKLHQIFHLH